MGLIYGVGFLISAGASVELGVRAYKKSYSFEETVKSIFYGLCAFGVFPGGALTGAAACVIHALYFKSDEQNFYFMEVIHKIKNLIEAGRMIVPGLVVRLFILATERVSFISKKDSATKPISPQAKGRSGSDDHLYNV